MLPNGVNGLSGGGAGVAQAVLTTLTQVASAAAESNVITGPAGILAGDLLVLWDYAQGVGVPASVVPTDFNIFATANDGSAARCILSYKIATGAEASASLTGMNSTVEDKVLLVFRGDIPITSVTPGGAAAVVQGTNPTAQVVPSSGGTPPLVVFGGYASSGAVNPRTMSPAKDGEVDTDGDCYLAWKIYNTAPADVTVDMDDEGDRNALASGYLACA